MAMFHPGVGDPSGFENPYKDGRPNWSLQNKTRIAGPQGKLGTGMVVLPPNTSPYAQPESQKDQLGHGRKHFGHHLANTLTEQELRGVNVPEHLVSGHDVALRHQGRRYMQPNECTDPKDGGVWEPVGRKYPTLERLDFPSGVRVVDKIPREPMKIDIWPDTITVRDAFKPGGLKMFAGKRSTNTEAFPGAQGYVPPQLLDAKGTQIDYSSVAQGGPFGRKMLHANEPNQMPDAVVATLKADRTHRSMAKLREGEDGRRAAARTPQGFAAAWINAEPAARPAPPNPFSAQMSRALDRSGSFSVPAPPSRRASVRPETTGPTSFKLQGKGQYEQPLKAATAWTFMGGYRP
mmetsp:Transcript_57491/g.137047  ORF Transcript_57491/g.137047 Transcript_57491/m.137047 type:complete len:349 (+) Transcript_57491:101-1147(+)